MERKEPTISGLDSVAAEPQSPRQQGKVAKKSVPKPKAVGSMQTRVVHKSSPLVPFALILALTGMGLAGFVYWELLKAQKSSAAAEARIVELEQKLDLSSDESSQSVTSLQANLKEANHEIRKLWDTRNVNKRSIVANKQSIDGVTKIAKSASSNASVAKKGLDAQKVSVDKLTAGASTVAAQLETALADVDTQTKQLRSLTDQANRLQAQLESLNHDMARRVADNEEAIEAIDASRLTVNREIQEIRRQLAGQPGA